MLEQGMEQGTEEGTPEFTWPRRFTAVRGRSMPALCLAAAAWLAWPSSLLAQADAITVALHQGKAPVAPDAITVLGPDLFGDRINLFNGSFSFEQTDVELPGNNALPVAIVRQFAPRIWTVRGAMADWDLSTPRIEGTFADPEGWVPVYGSPSNRCSGFNEPPTVTRGGGTGEFLRAQPAARRGAAVSAADPRVPISAAGYGAVDFLSWHYWGGTNLVVPGQGSQEILLRAPGNNLAPSVGGPYRLVTSKNWQIACLPTIQNAAGEGFVALAPDGVRYRFDWMATRQQSSLRNGSGVLQRRDHMLMATEVTDRFGNWVRYTYNAAQPTNLTRIESSDGRVITLAYANGRVASVFDGTRTWQYQYDANGDLRYVVRPDASRWSFNLRPMVYANTTVGDPGADCDSLPSMIPSGDFVGTMTHPSGAVGTFTSAFLLHGRTNVQRACTYIKGTTWTDGAVWPKTTLNQALTEKRISGPGMPTMVWRYSGDSNDPFGAWAPCTSCPDRKTVTVTEPSGALTRHTFGIRWRENEGQLLQLDEGWDGSSALRTTTYRYRDASGPQRYPDRFGDSVFFNSDHLSTRNRPQDLRQIVQQNVVFTWRADASSAGFDDKARPSMASLSSTLGYARSTLTQYDDNLARWVLGQPLSVTDLGSGRVPQRHEYDATTALPWRSWAFGRLVHTLTYWADGTLKSRDENAGRVTTFSDYMRGKPRQAVFADQSMASRGVTNLGNVAWITNEAGTTHTFGHDSMGLLARIDYPAGDPVSYYPTLMSFQPNATGEYGLPAGTWVRTITTGNAVTKRWLDGLWRVRLELRYDAADMAATQRFVETRYDAGGRVSFQSYPQRQFAAVDLAGTPGIRYVHDNLNREILRSADTELGAPAVTATRYLAGFQKQVTNARGHATTFGHQAFDQPSEEAIATIGLPDGSAVTIRRDNFGKPISITRSGLWQGNPISAARQYVYDLYDRLCITIEPETGATVQDYDGANNVAWKAGGLGLTGTVSCD